MRDFFYIKLFKVGNILIIKSQPSKKGAADPLTVESVWCGLKFIERFKSLFYVRTRQSSYLTLKAEDAP